MQILSTDAGSLRLTKFLGRLRAIIVEDSENDARVLAHLLAEESDDFESFRVESREEMEAALASGACDLVLCDHDLPDFDAFEALELLREHDLDIPLIIVTGAIGGEEAAVALMRKGASDYVPKHKLDRLVPAVRRELREAEVRRRKDAADEELRRKNRELQAALERLSEAQESLAKAERHKGFGQMAAGMAQDFTDSLSRILGIAEAIESHGLEPIAETVAHLKSAVADASAVVDRLSAGYRGPEAEAESSFADLNALVRETVDMTRPRWAGERRERAIEVLYDLAEGIPAIAGEPDEYREALANIVFNSCDAMPRGGKLGFRSRREADAAILEIIDTGVGMTPEVLEQCLDPFFTTKGDGGTGLGLALVDGLMQRRGGIVRVFSESNSGTTVRLRFPLAARSVAKEEMREPSVAPDEPLRVLVVEDEGGIASLIQGFLELDGHSVRSVPGGEEALARLAEEPFDVVVCDRILADIEAEELVRRIREQGGSHFIVMAVGPQSEEGRENARPEGVDHLLVKPLSRLSLQGALSGIGAGLPR